MSSLTFVKTKMVFKCQEDSFLTKFESKVVSCEPAKRKTLVNDTEQLVDGYDVICENTIIFPEGGGQPCDYGKLNDINVYNVIRKGADAIHFVTEPIEVGEVVKQEINWDRRLDHMQQHSGQHLITAIIDREFGFNTSSWWLGEEVSHIELDTPSITLEQIRKAEDLCNSLIRAGTNVTVAVTDATKLSGESSENDAPRARGLPEDHVGDIRIITIHGVESNMCCGTHVSNLCQLQGVKLLHAEKGKRKDKTLLYFLVGNRIFKKLSECLDREAKMMVLLKSNSNQHVELVDKLQKNLKLTTKNLQTVLKSLVVFEVERLKNLNPKPKYYALHRKEAEADFLSGFVKEYGCDDVLLFLTVGDEKTAGNLLLNGPEEDVVYLGPKISELLNGKGAGNGKRFQAKVQNMGNRSKCVALIEEYYKNL